jgi:membrane peptidoglycan carboxypeptidase
MNGETFTWVNDVVQAGIAITDINTGEIVALGGGRNIVGERVFNFATMLNKQIGSTAKPLFDYGPGIEFNNWSTYTPFVDEPHSYSNGGPIRNWDNKYMGFMTLKQALALSRNIPALKAFQSVNNKNIHDFTLGLGLKPEIEDGFVHEAHSLGGYNGSNPLELAAAYGAFGNGGFYIKPYSFTKIEYVDTKKTVEFSEPKIKAMSDSTAYIMTRALIYTVTNGLSGSANRSGFEIAAKTGTTNFDTATIKAHNLPYGAINDLWTIGYTPSYSIGLWYGYDKIDRNFVSTNADGSRKNRLFSAALDIVLPTSDKTFKRPSSVVNVSIEKGTNPGMLPSEFTPSNMITSELFKRGTEPFEISPRYIRLPNASNLRIENIGSTLKISWTKIDTPKYFTDGENSQNTLEELGSLVYEVYYKDSSGNLLKVGETSNDYINMNKPLDNIEMTFVVKTAWSLFRDNKSSGIELKYINVEQEQVAEPTVSLIGGSKITLSIGATFVDSNPPYRVTLNGDDITSSASLKSKVITKKSDNSIVQSIDTSVIETYYIDYIVLYNKKEYPLRRTVEVK